MLIDDAGLDEVTSHCLVCCKCDFIAFKLTLIILIIKWICTDGIHKPYDLVSSQGHILGGVTSTPYWATLAKSVPKVKVEVGVLKVVPAQRDLLYPAC